MAHKIKILEIIEIFNTFFESVEENPRLQINYEEGGCTLVCSLPSKNSKNPKFENSNIENNENVNITRTTSTQTGNV